MSGLTIFVLLFFADKTVLNNSTSQGEALSGERISDKGSEKIGATDLSAGLPELEPDAETDSLKSLLNQKTGNRAEVLKALAERLRDRGRIDLAAQYSGELAALNPDFRNQLVAGAMYRAASEELLAKGDSLLFDKFSDEAIRLLKLADNAKPKDEEAMIELGLALVGSGRSENSMQGIQTLVKVLEINPKNEEAAFRLGVFSLQTGQFEKAISRFQTVLSANPKNLEAKLLLAGAFRDSGKKAEAIGLLNALTSQNENSEVAALATEMLNDLKNK